VITEFQGKRIEDPRHLRLLVGQMKPGTMATFAYLRQSQEHHATAKLDEMPRPKTTQVAHKSNIEKPTDVLDGVTVTDMDSSIRSHLKIPRTVAGAIVLRVDDDSPAYAAGLRPGDVMQEINHKQVYTSQQAVDVSRQLRGQELLLRVWSDGGSRFMAINREPRKLHTPITPTRD
jgi:serine protease Do